MHQKNSQSGQTLIETILALFVLTMALVSGLGLVIYSTSTAAVTRDRIIATNLAREGLEVVRMLRDSNWLSGTLYETNGGCTYKANPSSSDNANFRKPCYPEAFHSSTAGFDLETTSSSSQFRVNYRPQNDWLLLSRQGNETYLICLYDGIYRHSSPGFSEGFTCDLTNSNFARRITISANGSFPYTPDTTGNSTPIGAPSGNNNNIASNGYGRHSPEKIITSTVVWQGKNCTPFPNANIDPVSFASQTKCKVIMTERLTNWKDYR